MTLKNHVSALIVSIALISQNVHALDVTCSTPDVVVENFSYTGAAQNYTPSAPSGSSIISNIHFELYGASGTAGTSSVALTGGILTFVGGTGGLGAKVEADLNVAVGANAPLQVNVGGQASGGFGGFNGGGNGGGVNIQPCINKRS